MILPQELEVWYVLPAIRKELARNLVVLGLKQKGVAEILDVTEACISNYFKSKRAMEIKFDSNIKSLIHVSALRLFKGESCFIKEVQKICNAFKEGEYLCSLHKKFGNVCGCRGCLT